MTKKKRFSPASEKGHFSYYIMPSFRPQPSRYASRFTRYELCSLYKQILPRTPSRQTRSLHTYQLGPRNLRNLWLINDLRLRILTYEIIKHFYAKRTQFPKSQMNVSDCFTMNYEQKTMNYQIKNEPKRTQFQKGRNERNVLQNRGI
jgi:hypothetical protein